MIEITNLVKRYGANYAVNDISFSVGKGEIVGFLGPNGAGKTTTMNILTGYLSATSGSARIGGADILENPFEAKSKIGFLPEQPPLYLDMTAREYLNFVHSLKRCTLNRKLHIDEICEVVRITDVSKRLIKHLSKGYRQRVGIAQALVGNPEVLIFDEPTVGLDPKQIIEIRNLIRALGKTHTIILSTHILPEVQAVCDRIVIINKGKLAADEKTENLADILTDPHRLTGEIHDTADGAPDPSTRRQGIVSSETRAAVPDGPRKFTAEICGPADGILQALNEKSGIVHAELLKERKDGSVRVFIESRPDVDIRKPLFFLLAEKNWPLVGLERVGASLEDIYISLIKEEE